MGVVICMPSFCTLSSRLVLLLAAVAQEKEPYSIMGRILPVQTCLRMGLLASYLTSESLFSIEDSRPFVPSISWMCGPSVLSSPMPWQRVVFATQYLECPLHMHTFWCKNLFWKYLLQSVDPITFSNFSSPRSLMLLFMHVCLIVMPFSVIRDQYPLYLVKCTELESVW